MRSCICGTITGLIALAVGPAMAQEPVGSQAPIDREALVTRHNVTLTEIDPQAAVMVGNGDLAMAVDITGLQTFRDQYSPHSPLMTQAQWAWHSFPGADEYELADAMKPIEAHGETYLYPYVDDWAEAEDNPAFESLRRNPHRFSLGRLSFVTLSDGEASPLPFEAVGDTRQTLDLWNGEVRSDFTIDGTPVSVVTAVHPVSDLIIAEITSPLIASGDLGVELAFPYVSQTLNPDPADWTSPDAHESVFNEIEHGAFVERQLDEMAYTVTVEISDGASLRQGTHRLIAANKGEDTLRIVATFLGHGATGQQVMSDAVLGGTNEWWNDFWQSGGAVDLSGSSDPRAEELERRIVLSQYLTAINAAGSLPPQEEGLYANSWNGKFHHEMHVWHGAHFPLWGRAEMLARSMDWYLDSLPQARERAAFYGREGAWWPKMTGPDAVESPSTINPFIMWQQPNPIYLAEMLYRSDGETAGEGALERYSEVVFETADLLASFPVMDEETGRLVLGPPVIPVQEVYDAARTEDPAFELAYFRWGLETAQAWRERLGMDRNAEWDAALAAFPPLPEKGGLYLPVASRPDFWETSSSDACAHGIDALGTLDTPGAALPAHCQNRDHQSFLMVAGLIPGAMAEADTLTRTMDRMDAVWDYRHTWGWDYPMLAMTATRLGQPERAIDYLMMDAPNNDYGVTGMTPRYHHGADGFEKNADTYFPSNGSLLTAIALMTAGWDGNEAETPGFPEEGWVVRYEGIAPLP